MNKSISQMTKVMVIEDDQNIANELKIHLSYIYCNVTASVDSGEKALEAVSSNMPDVIFLNIGIGIGVDSSMNASEIAKEIRTLYHIPIIFIVGYENEPLIHNVKLDFPFGYILTPISTRELKIAVDTAIYTAEIEDKRVQAQNELRKIDERYKALFDNMPSGIAIYKVIGDGEDFVFLDFNKAAEKIDNQKREELIGRSIFDARPGIHQSNILNTFKEVLKTGKPHHHPITLYKDDRITKYYENYVYKLSSGELVAIFTDETLKKQSQDDIKNLENQLAQAQKMEAIGTMAGGIAHDFNNILFPILGCAELLIQDAHEGSSQREFLNEILKAGNRAKELVKQILTFSRQEIHEVMPLAIEPISKEIIKLSRAMIPSTIKIIQDISKKCPMVMVDPTHIHQIFMNLITNAFHAMEDTGGTLTIRVYGIDNNNIDYNNPARISSLKNTFLSGLAQGFSAEKYLCIEMIDTGIGMDNNTLQRIFEPYFTNKKQGKGTGLGLSIVHGIIRNCKGDIEVATEKGKGSCFKVYLPAVEQKSIVFNNSPPVNQFIGNETILVVDDEAVIVKMLSKILERAGYKVFGYTDSTEALNAFRHKPSMFDLVITDLTMPGITGEKLCAALKLINPKPPVIVCTGFSEKVSDFKQNDNIYKVDKFIMKPIISYDLLKMVRELLDSI